MTCRRACPVGAGLAACSAGFGAVVTGLVSVSGLTGFRAIVTGLTSLTSLGAVATFTTFATAVATFTTTFAAFTTFGLCNLQNRLVQVEGDRHRRRDQAQRYHTRRGQEIQPAFCLLIEHLTHILHVLAGFNFGDPGLIGCRRVIPLSVENTRGCGNIPQMAFKVAKSSLLVRFGYPKPIPRAHLSQGPIIGPADIC